MVKLEIGKGGEPPILSVLTLMESLGLPEEDVSKMRECLLTLELTSVYTTPIFIYVVIVRLLQKYKITYCESKIFSEDFVLALNQLLLEPSPTLENYVEVHRALTSQAVEHFHIDAVTTGEVDGVPYPLLGICTYNELLTGKRKAF